jgi:hypothetical protein
MKTDVKSEMHNLGDSVLNPCESSDDICHRLSFLISQTRFMCSIGHFGAKTANV